MENCYPCNGSAGRHYNNVWVFLTKVISFFVCFTENLFFSYQTFFLMIYRGNKPERNYQAHAGGEKKLTHSLALRSDI